MYAVEVRDHMMIAHSLPDPVFGPAQGLHGATFVVDVDVRARTLDADGIVVDIGRAASTLRAVLAELNFRNLDEEPAFKGHNTTSEFLSRVVYERMADAARRGDLGRPVHELESLRVTLHESHVASAGFEGPLADREA